MSAKLRSHWSQLLLILAVLSLFIPTLLHPTHILFPTFSQFSDLMVIHWPKAQLIAQSWQAGQGLPYWTPLILSGMPLAANQLAMLFYPPAWLFLIFPIEPVFNLLFIFHLLLGGFGIYFLLREGHGLSPSAALLGGLTFALNGKWLAHAAGGHVSMVGAVGWLPWVVYGMHMLLRTGGEEAKRRNGNLPISPPPSLPPLLSWAVLAAIVLAMQIFTHTLLVLYSVYLIAAMVIWHLIWHSQWRAVTGQLTFEPLKRLLIPVLTIPVLAGLLGAVQLLPLLELTQYSNRALSASQAAQYAVSPVQLLVGLFLPAAQAGHELIIYVGLVPLLLAPLGLSRKNRWTWFYGALFVFSILFALGPNTPIHTLFYNFAPGFRWVRTPARIFFVGALALAVLVGFGVHHLQHRRWSAAATRWLTRLTVALGGLTLLVGLGLAWGFGQANRAAFALALVVPAGLILILGRVRRMISAPTAITLLGLLLYLDLAAFALSLMRFVSLEEALAPGRPAAEYLAQKTELFRTYSPSYSLPMQTAAATGLSLADGVEPVHLAIYDRYMAQAGGYQDDSFSVTLPNFGGGPLESALENVEPNLALLGLLNVKYLVSAFPMAWPGLSLETEIDGTFIYHNEHSLPRAWLTNRVSTTETDELGPLETLPVASLVPGQSEAALSTEDEEGLLPPGPVKITHYSTDRIEIEVEDAPPDSWLVLSEIWYPGWQATVNGSRQPVKRVNGLLRGLYLHDPGSYHITMEYRPRSISVGGWISSLTAGLIIVAGLWTRFGMSVWRKKDELSFSGSTYHEHNLS